MSREVLKTPLSQKVDRRDIKGFEEDPQSVKLNKVIRGTKTRKGWGDLKADLADKMSNNFQFDVKDRNASLSTYNKYLADIVINGNMRVKFIPKCSTRAGARLYCSSKLDESGYPRYKLIGTNATDPFGNKICDMNGDQVDDIIICNREGVPVIINGYKLVQASPYKKIWKNEKAAGKTDDAFDRWLAIQFDATKDWTKITEEQWGKGKTGWELKNAPKVAQDAYNFYKDAGLGKARISTRVSPNSAWSSLFAKYIWKDVVYSFCGNSLTYRAALKVADYLKVANAMYIKYVELPVAKQLGNDKNWISWVNYKQLNGETVRKALCKRVQEIYTYLQNNAETDEQRNNLIDSKNGFYYAIHLDALNILVECLGGEEYISNLGASIQAKTVSAQDIKGFKEDFRQDINGYIDNYIFNGYAQYILQKNQSKVKPIKDLEKYALMRWKNNDNDVGFDSDDDEQI